jgi:putative oxidoreductase
MDRATTVSILLRGSIAIVMLAHGWNHAFGGGRLAGTARWFESIGMRPARLHALAATTTELLAGFCLLAGFAVPVAAGAVLGTMLVALVTNHARNGFFIFRPGEGYEYVLFIALVSMAAGSVGGGRFSLDELTGWQLSVGAGLGLTAGLGLFSAAATLAFGWRPRSVQPDET